MLRPCSLCCGSWAALALPSRLQPPWGLGYSSAALGRGWRARRPVLCTRLLHICPPSHRGPSSCSAAPRNVPLLSWSSPSLCPACSPLQVSVLDFLVSLRFVCCFQSPLRLPSPIPALTRTQSHGDARLHRSDDVPPVAHERLTIPGRPPCDRDTYPSLTGPGAEQFFVRLGSRELPP